MSLHTITSPERRKKLLVGLSAFALLTIIVLGIFARNGWLPRTDALTGKKTGWFGSVPPAVAGGLTQNGNPAIPPSATPQLSKEYIYAGLRLLAVEDANANAAPPADLAVWRPSSGVWWVYNLVTTTWTSYYWGWPDDKPVEGDYDGDGKTDFAIARPPSGGAPYEWHLAYSGGGTLWFQLGFSGDIPLAADFDGDGKSDPIVYRPANGTWYWLTSSSGFNTYLYLQFGNSTDLPKPADFDGDGKADIAVWRDSDHTFYSINSSNGATQYLSFGATGDKPVPADYDGDGKADHAVWRGGNGTWYIRQSSNNYSYQMPYGLGTDTPVPNDYDGDGKCDIAIWRPATSAVWYIYQSSNTQTRTEFWGTTGDIPVAAFWRR